MAHEISYFCKNVKSVMVVTISSIFLVLEHAQLSQERLNKLGFCSLLLGYTSVLSSSWEVVSWGKCGEKNYRKGNGWNERKLNVTEKDQRH